VGVPGMSYAGAFPLLINILAVKKKIKNQQPISLFITMCEK
jgi:hypothetical protein